MSAAKSFLLMGGALMAVGIFLWWRERSGSGAVASWLGRLPGDIRAERPGLRFYFPLTTCLLVSALLTGLVWISRRLGR